jgi:hypothetical protein
LPLRFVGRVVHLAGKAVFLMSSVMTANQDSSSAALFGRRLGRYQVLNRLAVGGMGSVYAARALGVAGFERLFAVKVLHPHLASEREFIAMFLDEARLAARIHHTNVVSTIDVSSAPETGYYLVMDYVAGDHLGALMRRAARSGERLPVRDALRIVVDALGGLAAAHQLADEAGNPLNLVHRDISPQNILVGRDGIARLTDFGVARAENRLSTTREGQFKGKLCYMAPEQAVEGQVDQRSDLFAMGVVLWECITGRRLFWNDRPATVLYKICREPIPAPSSVDVELKRFDPVLSRALERDVDRRFQSAVEFAAAIEEAVGALGGLGSRRTVGSLVERYASRKLALEQESIREAMRALDTGSVAEKTPGARPTAGAASVENRKENVKRGSSRLAWVLGGIGTGITISVAVIFPSLFRESTGQVSVYSLREPERFPGELAERQAASRSMRPAWIRAPTGLSVVVTSAAGAGYGPAGFCADDLLADDSSSGPPFDREPETALEGAETEGGPPERSSAVAYGPSRRTYPVDGIPENPFEPPNLRKPSLEDVSSAYGRVFTLADIPDNPFEPPNLQEPSSPDESRVSEPARRVTSPDDIPDNPF